MGNPERDSLRLITTPDSNSFVNIGQYTPVREFVPTSNIHSPLCGDRRLRICGFFS